MNARTTKRCALVLALGAALAVAARAEADSWTVITTPRGTDIEVYSMDEELTPADIAATDDYLASAYPRARVLRHASRRYNCHSFAWYSQTATNSVWIDTPGDDTYWTDGSYEEVAEEDAPAGAKASYASDDHSAIRARQGFVSKWGSGPLMAHEPAYAPYDSSDIRYYVPAR